MARIPGLIEPRWYDREWLVELLSGVPPLAALIWGACDSFIVQRGGKGATLLIAGVLLTGASVLKVVRGRGRDQARKKAESPTDLLGCAHVIHKALCKYLKADSTQLRITIHRVFVEPHQGRDDEEEYFEQVIPYIGGDGNGPGRRWPTSVGIVGRVAREGCPIWALRQGQDKQHFIEELVHVWHYSKKAAKKLTDDRTGWIAVPIFDESPNVVGVVYVDSIIKSHVNEDTCGFLVELAEGVAAFIRRRYK